MTRVRLPITTTEDAPDGPAIAIGRGSVTDRHGLAIPDDESCLLKTLGQVVVIAGGRKRGTMYGVFCFLEKLGCRWFTNDVARIPAARGISIPALDEIARPAFAYREVFFTEAQAKEWSARNRLNGHFHKLDQAVGGKVSYFPFAHSFYQLIPPGQHFSAHPEYFALVAGRRRGQRAQLCLTNADIAGLATERIQKWLTENPDVAIVSISQNDGSGWCECEPCRAVVREEEGAVSGALLRFVNQVARRIALSHPGKIVDTLAYQKSADPPAVVTPLPNVQIRLCPIDSCQAHPYESCPYNRQFEQRLSAWARIAPRLVLWQYSINFSHFLLPFPNEQELVVDIPRFKRAGVSGMFIEGAVSEGGGGENAELRAYLAARLLWNPEIDVNAEIRGFLSAVYGPAAPLMAQYLALRRSETLRSDRHLWIDQDVSAPYLTDSFLKVGRELLERAYAKAEPGSARRRIERCALSLDYVDVMRRRQCYAGVDFYGPENPDRLKLETENFVHRAEMLGITHLREGYPLAAEAQAFEELGKAYPLLAIEDDAVAVKIVPELGARVIALGPRGRQPAAAALPSTDIAFAGANVLRVPGPGEFSYPYAGGLRFGLASNYLSTEQRVGWRTERTAKEFTSLRGLSDQGLDLEMDFRVEAGILHIRMTATNPGPIALPAVLLCQAEFAMQPWNASRPARPYAAVHYTTRSGEERDHRIDAHDFPADDNFILEGEECARESCTLLVRQTRPNAPGSIRKIQNRFRDQQVKRSEVRWSFRSAPRVTMSLWTPEVVLASGEQISLESGYELMESERF